MTSTNNNVPTGVLGFLLSSIPRPMLLQMYGDNERGLFVCIAVMRVMPVVSRQFAVRLLGCGGAFEKNMMKLWTKDGDLSSSRSTLQMGSDSTRQGRRRCGHDA